MKKTIIFDFDGVILDSVKVAFYVLDTLHKKYDLPELTDELLQELFEDNIFISYQKFGISDEKQKAFKADFKELFQSKYGELKFFEGIVECIPALTARYDLMIVSSNHSETIRQMLKTEGLDIYFSKIIGAEESGTKREKIIAYIEAQKLERKNVYFVSDTAGDIREVEGMGIHKVAVSWGYHSHERLLHSHPDVIVHSPQELQYYFIKLI